MIDFQVSFQMQDTFSIQQYIVENQLPFFRILLEFYDEYQIEEFPDYLFGRPIIAFHVLDHIKSKTAVSVDFFWFNRIFHGPFSKRWSTDALVTNHSYFLIFSSLIVFEFQPFVILRPATLKEIVVNLENLQVHLKSSFEILLFAILHFRPMKNLSKIEFEIYEENINQNVFQIILRLFLRVVPNDFCVVDFYDSRSILK